LPAGVIPWDQPAVSWIVTYVRSSVGAKQIMALTGLGLVVFALFHMVGHLGMFAGRDAYNSYAHFLQSLGTLKWLARGGLLFIFVVHVVMAIRLVSLNRAARPVKYAVYRPAASSVAGRTMAWTGVVVLAFVIYHLMHFTLGMVQPEYFHTLDATKRFDAYSMFVRGFQSVPIYASYLVAIALLSTHLAHGAVSWLQSLGLRHPKYDLLMRALGPGLTAILFVGYMAPPTAALLGMIAL
jgi:succinate dehydrogenase / fumarate reductase, cytochrome b subunit